MHDCVIYAIMCLYFVQNIIYAISDLYLMYLSHDWLFYLGNFKNPVHKLSTCHGKFYTVVHFYVSMEIYHSEFFPSNVDQHGRAVYHGKRTLLPW